MVIYYCTIMSKGPFLFDIFVRAGVAPRTEHSQSKAIGLDFACPLNARKLSLLTFCRSTCMQNDLITHAQIFGSSSKSTKSSNGDRPLDS